MVSINELAASIYENQLNVAIGRVVVSWNTLCLEISGLFQALTDLPEESAEEIFFTMKSDRDQRMAVRNLAKTLASSIGEDIGSEIEHCLRSIDSMAQKRNDVLHVAYIDSLSPKQANTHQKRGELSKLKGQDLIQYIDKLSIEFLDKAMEVLNLRIQVEKALHPKNKDLIKLLQTLIDEQLYKNEKPKQIGLLGLPQSDDNREAGFPLSRE